MDASHAYLPGKPPTRKAFGNCHICGKPVYVSPGQRILITSDKQLPSHKECRKLRRKGKM